MLASRLAAPGYSVTVSSDPGTRDVDWIVRATITRLGEVYSVDAALEPVQAQGDGTRTYETANSPDALFPALEAVAQRLKTALQRIASIPPAAPVAKSAEAPPAAIPPPQSPAVSPPQPTPAPVPQPAAIPPLPSAPTVAPQSAPSPAPLPTAAPAEPPLGAESTLVVALRTVRAGPTFRGEARSVTVTDADGDGTAEILVLADREIHAFQDREGQIIPLWKRTTPKAFDPLVLSAGDIDGNGLPEVFVAGMDETWPVTQTFEWRGSALAPKGERIPAFARVVERPGDGPLLLGMVKSLGRQVFSPGVRSFSWDGKSYNEQGKFRAPRAAVGVNLDLVTLAEGRPPFTVVTTQVDRLEIYDPGGERIFRGGDRVKGTRTIILGLETLPGALDDDIVRVYGKTLGWRGPDGSDYTIVSNNHSAFSRYLSREFPITNGQILLFRWDGLTLLPIAESPKIPGYIPDAALGPSPGRPGARTVYLALVQAEGTFIKKMRTRILAYDLPGGRQAE
jgi:hypothetical protein